MNIKTGSISDMVSGRFNGELVIIVAGSGIPRSRYQHLLDDGEDIRHLARFAPSRATLKQFKEDGDEEAYIINFNKDMDKKNRVDELMSICENTDLVVRLVCHEPEGEFCHRHLLIDLLHKSETSDSPEMVAVEADLSLEEDIMNNYEEELEEDNIESDYSEYYDIDSESDQGVTVLEPEEEVEEDITSSDDDEPAVRWFEEIPVRDSRILPSSWSDFYQPEDFNEEEPWKYYETARGHLIRINKGGHDIIVSDGEETIPYGPQPFITGSRWSNWVTNPEPIATPSLESKDLPRTYPIITTQIREQIEAEANRPELDKPSIHELTDSELSDAIRAIKPNDKGAWIRIRGSKFGWKDLSKLVREQSKRNMPATPTIPTYLGIPVYSARAACLLSVKEIATDSMFDHYWTYTGRQIDSDEYLAAAPKWIQETIRIYTSATGKYNFADHGYKEVRVQPAHDGYKINPSEEPRMAFDGSSGPRIKLSGVNTNQVDTRDTPEALIHHYSQMSEDGKLIFDEHGMLDRTFFIEGGSDGCKTTGYVTDLESIAAWAPKFVKNGHKSAIIDFEEVTGEWEWEARIEANEKHIRNSKKNRRLAIWINEADGLRKMTPEDAHWIDARGRVLPSEAKLALEAFNDHLDTHFTNDTPELPCNKKSGGFYNLQLVSSLEIIEDLKAHIGQAKRWTDIFRNKEFFYYDPKHAEYIRPATGEVMGAYIKTDDESQRRFHPGEETEYTQHYAPFQKVYTQTKRPKKKLTHGEFMQKESYKNRPSLKVVFKHRSQRQEEKANKITRTTKPIIEQVKQATYLGVPLYQAREKGIVQASSRIQKHPFVKPRPHKYLEVDFNEYTYWFIPVYFTNRVDDL